MASIAQCFQFDDVEVRPAAFEVVKAGKVLSLEPKAIRVLIYLVERRDRAVSKEELLGAIWDGVNVTDNALTRVIAQLRKELQEDARQPKYIQTIPTLGYRFVAELAEAEAAPSLPERPTRARSIWVFAAVGMACAVAALVWLQHPKVVSPPRIGSMVQFTTSPGVDLGATFSPDGRSIVYSSDRSGRFEIYVRSSESQGKEIAITSDGKQNLHPAWSPDGKSVAFYSVARGGICVVGAQGGEVRQLTNFGSSPTWSPDSTRIAFRSVGVFSLTPNDALGNGASTIWEVPARGGTPHQLTRPGQPEGTHGFPAWSPDGKFVVFAAVSNAKPGGLYAVDPSSGSLRQLLKAVENSCFTPVLSPDGKWLYYAAASQALDFGIWRFPLNPRTGQRSGDPVQIVRTGSSIPQSPAISPDGKRLAYTYTNMVSQLWTMPVNGASGARPLFRDSVFRAIHPAFSPDGSRIAFIARRFGLQADVWVMSADGSDATPISSEPEPEFLPVWSADGRSIFHTLHRKNGTEIWQHSVNGSLRKKIWWEVGSVGWPRVSQTGTFLVYQTGTPANLWRRDLTTGASRQLSFDKEGASFPSISPDGQWIAYEVSRGENTYLAVMDADGRASNQLTQEPGQAWGHGWSPDNRKILYAGFFDGAWNIWWLDRITGERRKLTNFTSMDSYVRYPAWSPKEDQIVFEYGAIRGNIYLVDIAE